MFQYQYKLTVLLVYIVLRCSWVTVCFQYFFNITILPFCNSDRVILHELAGETFVNGGLAYVGCPKSNVQHFLFQTHFIYIIHLTLKAFSVVSSHLTTAAQCSGNFYIPCNCPLQLISPICQVMVVFMFQKTAIIGHMAVLLALGNQEHSYYDCMGGGAVLLAVN